MITRYLFTISCIAFSFNCLADSFTVSPIKVAKPQDNTSELQVGQEKQDAKLTVKGTIASTLSADPKFSTLVILLKASGLFTPLSGGSFTLLAPNNSAFDKLPSGTLEELLKPENQPKLKAILSYHVIPGRFMSADIKPGMIKTLNGKEINIMIGNEGVMINNAKVIKADSLGTNGIVHEIDTVLVP